MLEHKVIFYVADKLQARVESLLADPSIPSTRPENYLTRFLTTLERLRTILNEDWPESAWAEFSHDIRTPIAVLRTSSYLLQRTLPTHLLYEVDTINLYLDFLSNKVQFFCSATFNKYRPVEPRILESCIDLIGLSLLDFLLDKIIETRLEQQYPADLSLLFEELHQNLLSIYSFWQRMQNPSASERSLIDSNLNCLLSCAKLLDAETNQIAIPNLGTICQYSEIIKQKLTMLSHAAV